MTHLTEATILAVRDREQVADEALAHLDQCDECIRAVESARARAHAVERALAVLALPVRVTEERRPPEEEARPATGRVVPIGRERKPGLEGTDEGRRAGDVAAGPGRADVTAGTGAGVTPIDRGRRDAESGPRVRGDTAKSPRAEGDAARRPRVRGGVRTLRWFGRAAVLVLVGAGALAALPGPFNGWIPWVFSGAPPVDAPAATAPEPPGQVGGRMAVAGGPVVVRLETVPPGTVIDVRRGTGQAVGVLAGTGSEFAYGDGEVRASVVAGPVMVELPEGVVPATLIVNGGVYLVVNAAGMEVPGPVGEVGEGSLMTFQVPN